jgi:NADPH:quinone reductase
MKAVVLDDQGEFRVTEIDEPAPRTHEVLIEVEYAGVQWGDVLVRDGHFPVSRPFVPGFEAAGRIIAVGSGEDEGRIGDPVVALTSSGAYAEKVVASSVLTFDVGELSIRTAGGFGWVTPAAFDLINTVARVQPGDTVLIHAGAGGVGALAVQFARLAGARRLVGVVANGAQVGYATQFGYDEVVLREDFPATLLDEHFDVILDPIGGPTRLANVERLEPHGRLVVYGNIATFEQVNVSTNDLLMQGQSLLTYNSSLLSQTNPDRLAETARAALDYLVRDRVRVDITAEYPLDEVALAIDRLSMGDTLGKSVVRIDK